MMIPPGKVQALSRQPDTVLSFIEIARETIAVKYTGDADLDDNHYHLEIVRKQLTRKLPLLTSDVYNELVLGIEDQWAAKRGKWTTVPGFDSCMKIVSRAANRVFCGPDLCE